MGIIALLGMLVSLPVHAAPDHAAWDALLKSGVSADGPATLVDYRALKAKSGEIQGYLRAWAELPAAEWSALSRDDRVAAAINTHNAAQVLLVLEKYPAPGWDLLPGGASGSPFKLQGKIKLGGKERSFEEHVSELVRRAWGEPMALFALTCPSRRTCPSLSAEAYLGARLKAQLKSAQDAFMNDGRRNHFAVREKQLYASALFEHYGGDFKKKFKSVKAFLAETLAKGPDEAKTMKAADVDLNIIPADPMLDDKAQGALE